MAGAPELTYTSAVVLMVMAVAVAIGAAVQVSGYFRKRQLITRPQLVLRLVTAALLMAIIGMIFYGTVHHWPDALSELVFWCVLTLVAVVVIVLSVIDLRLLERQRHLEQAAIYRALQDLQDKKGPGGAK